MTEYYEHSQVCQFLKLQYPDIIFTSDLSGVRLPVGLAVKVSRLKSDRGIPDLLIFEPRNGYHGLFIEMKRTGEKLLKKDGSFKSDHLKEQCDLHIRLRSKGYYCEFAAGFDEAKKIIENYMM